MVKVVLHRSRSILLNSRFDIGSGETATVALFLFLSFEFEKTH